MKQHKIGDIVLITQEGALCIGRVGTISHIYPSAIAGFGYRYRISFKKVFNIAYNDGEFIPLGEVGKLLYG